MLWSGVALCITITNARSVRGPCFTLISSGLVVRVTVSDGKSDGSAELPTGRDRLMAFAFPSDSQSQSPGLGIDGFGAHPPRLGPSSGWALVPSLEHRCSVFSHTSSRPNRLLEVHLLNILLCKAQSTCRALALPRRDTRVETIFAERYHVSSAPFLFCLCDNIDHSLCPHFVTIVSRRFCSQVLHRSNF